MFVILALLALVITAALGAFIANDFRKANEEFAAAWNGISEETRQSLINSGIARRV